MTTTMTEIETRSDIAVELVQSAGSDASIIAAARVSTAAELSAAALDQDPTESEGLINFLMKGRHGSPFEHAQMTFLISAPIFVFREWHRHRVGWSYNEESARYRQMRPVFYVPDERRNLKQIGKPGAYEFVPGEPQDLIAAHLSMEHIYGAAYAAYEDMLELGIAREVARVVLPVATYSTMYATCNPRSLMHFLSLRTKSDDAMFKSFPQREIEIAAEKMEAEFARLFPITHEAWVRNGRVAP
jgi:thymidylate synthase (FAD)